MVIIIVVGCGGFYRYRQVNAHPQQYGVTKEQLFHKNELVKAYHVNFIVHEAAVKKSKDVVQAKVKFHIRQTGRPFYGERKNNPNFIENMYLNNPYGTSNPSVKLYDKVTTVLILIKHWSMASSLLQWTLLFRAIHMTCAIKSYVSVSWYQLKSTMLNIRFC